MESYADTLILFSIVYGWGGERVVFLIRWSHMPFPLYERGMGDLRERLP